MDEKNIKKEEISEEEKHSKQEIVVVSGDGKDLDISKVYNHLNIDDSNSEHPDKNTVVIPTTKK